MDQQEVMMSEIVVVTNDSDPARLDALAEQLKRIRATVESVDHDNAVIHATAPAAHLGEIRKLPDVVYVRSVFTYADEPAAGADDEQIPR
jgi:16S rRNA C967 or C1407 C5-methylase (RsmB/RsmF family)